MRWPIPNPRATVWIKMFWAIMIYLAVEFGLAFMVKIVLNKATGELVIPYLAFAIPIVILLPMALLLRKWETQGASFRQIAFGWVAFLAIFVFTINFAVFYSGVKFHLVDPGDAGFFIVAAAIGTVVMCASMFFTVRTSLAARLRMRDKKMSSESDISGT